MTDSGMGSASGAYGRGGGGGRSGRAVAVTAAGVLATAVLAAGCGPLDPEADAQRQPPVRATTAPPASSPTDDGKGAAEPAATTPPASPSAPPPSTEPVTAPPPTPSSPAPAPSTAPPAPQILMRTGSEGGQVRELQARLRQIGHFGRNPTGYYGTVTADAVRSFQAKRGTGATGSTDAVTWRKLLAMTRTPTADELDPPTERPVAKPDKRCLTGRVLCISKKSRTLAWMIDGRVVSAMDVRFGSEYTPTREGEFPVYWKSRDHVSTLYDTPMPYALFFSGGQAVHYSADFAANGYGGASHGCVNVRDKKKVAALFDQVRNGDKVVIYW
ncbi:MULTISPECIES: L,D-transpeptidase family protein [unclassified Streptomyces]|uniref:L,D-transpeptidase family protein n=1 Tax=unclassified Streptomyces TaxID=2593676 RepID=UPI00081DF7AA|nr:MULTISPECIES: L,D-transpeptidase family protein [unclassified Streptomyces]MYR95147.1 L,D-transpeptidase family protein [Streptomyces sp. SID4937]SCD84834.1 Peptidoglycan-binding (PGRP) domain of peptidoglycan hydrolases-containing protein [Streptomyces sp. ScaeMP-e83]